MATATYKKGKLYELPIIDLKPDPNQPRKSMDPQALEELTASVKRVGIIQPLLEASPILMNVSLPVSLGMNEDSSSL